MPSTFRAKYKDQLPVHSKITWERVLNITGSLSSVVALYIYFAVWSDFTSDTKYVIGLSYMAFLVILLLSYIFVKETSKKHRFAQAVYHIHFVNHAIRDYLAGVQIGKNEQLSSVLDDIVDAISACFSIVEGRQCRCTIKEVKKEEPPKISTVARDSISRVSSANTHQCTHAIIENTDFEDLWHGKSGSSRYFLGKNLKKMWRNGKYKNSSFKVYGDPDRVDVLIFSWVTNWRLPYNSTLVWPIRFIPDHAYWPPTSGTPVASDDPRKVPHIWGFLCVDANTSKAFRSPQSAELGAAFADALYTLFRQVEMASTDQSAAVTEATGGA